ncbi:ATP-binding cassette domain-containing protein [Herbidospora sp. NEAU-GS84]|uniref:ATP-binding cassette domain-containing protein n=2 Tax=Herbidospora solisilvae TaxID=2696284 RepID=A0A7C9N3D2_9ACTN|nr:ATP-binding cassette domain-containing protein [Herbidospora solisilvae]
MRCSRRGMSVIDVREVVKSYGAFTALHGVDLKVHAGEFLAVVGRSGSGKSTLINMITGIDRPTSGEVHVAGAAVHTMSENELAGWRGRNIGVVFQFFQLLPTLTVAENVMLPMDFCGTYPGSRKPRALDLLERVGIADQAGKLPAELSGGQQQRAAIARALANEPPLLVADEPTGNLDSATATAVLELFAGIAADGTTVVMVTHGREAAPYITATVELADGRVV